MFLKLITLLAALGSAGIAYFSGGFAGYGWLWILPLSFAGLFLLLAAATVGIVWALCQRIDLDKPAEQDSPFYRKLASLCIEALIQLLRVRVHATGLEKIPTEGRFMLVCNHIFAADPGILLHALPGSQLAFISKQENQNLFVVGRIMHAMLCQCIDRNNDRSALKTILECIRIIKADQASIAVFPEGATNSDNRLHPFRPGVFKIAQKCNVPIVVCTLQGTREILKNGLRLRPTDVRLNLVTVIPPEEFEGLKTTEISDRVFAIMESDLDEEYKPL